MVKIHIFGDSHASQQHSYWKDTEKYKFIDYWLGPKLMYSFGRDKLRLLNIKNYSVVDGDIVCFSFGEIDCRCHVHKHITDTQPYQYIIDTLVDQYMNAIKLNTKEYTNLTTLINMIPPPLKSPQKHCDEFPFLGTFEDRKLYVEYCNKKLKELSDKNGFIFIDIYDKYIDKEGALKVEYSDKICHIIYNKPLVQFLDIHLKIV